MNMNKISEFLELDEIIAPDPKDYLYAQLDSNSNDSFKKGNSMRKFKYAIGEDIKPGYSSESQFACRHCGKRYRWKSTMRRHELVECGGKEPAFQCPFCQYKAKQKGNLGVHIRKHHNNINNNNNTV